MQQLQTALLPPHPGAIPVVYIVFGEMPLFLQINIELAARRNPVVVITDVAGKKAPWYNTSVDSRRRVVHEPMDQFFTSAAKFAPLYKHM